jgi:hypothetical protein
VRPPNATNRSAESLLDHESIQARPVYDELERLITEDDRQAA